MSNIGAWFFRQVGLFDQAEPREDRVENLCRVILAGLSCAYLAEQLLHVPDGQEYADAAVREQFKCWIWALLSEPEVIFQ
ncbi:MAG TPA: hypothetical protein VNI55_11340 [Gaiellaceae bacterium]|nr:hypothetical protein [Gaiellaceae bacterium]